MMSRCLGALLACLTSFPSQGADLPSGVLAKVSWHGHSYVLMEANTWAASEAKAQSLGGHLVTIDSAEENEFVLQKFLHFPLPQPGGFWIGLHRGPKGKWQWADSKSKVRFTDWGQFQPDNTNDAEPCVQIVGTGLPLAGKWNDFPNDPAACLKQICYGIVEIKTP